jgi:hypothetical protein
VREREREREGDIWFVHCLVHRPSGHVYVCAKLAKSSCL